MSSALLVAWCLAGASASSGDVVIADLTGAQVVRTNDFTVKQCPFALGGSYLQAASGAPGARPGSLRIAAPAGTYYVYLVWVRHPRGAKDVRVRLRESEVRVDQSRLANGRSPDEFPHNHMEEYRGECSSGLYRLTDRPVALARGDVVEIHRSDTSANAVTTLDYVVFSPALYLDDAGNDALWSGRPTINLRDYGAGLSGEIGFGGAFLGLESDKGSDAAAAVEWTVPSEGLFLLEIQPSRGPNRAETFPLEIALADGRTLTRPVAGKSRQFGREEWQRLGVLRAAKGMKLRARPASQGIVAPDLVRLTPVDASAVVKPGEERFDTVTVQWQSATPRRPWLREVRVVSLQGGAVTADDLGPAAEYAQGRRLRIPRQKMPILGDEGAAAAVPGTATFRVELADDYGFTLSTETLRREPLVRLDDLGILVRADPGLEGRSEACPTKGVDDGKLKTRPAEPFRSTSEKYLAWAGYDEARARQDDRAFEFAYRVPRPRAPRTAEAIRAMPEVDYRYFCERLPDVKHRRMFLGWPNVAQEFYVLSNGAVGASSGSALGTGHPPAQDFVVQLGAGDPPAFKEHGDTSVTQDLDDGYHLVVHTRWRQGAEAFHATAVAYPLAGEEVRTGYEPLAAFLRLRRRGTSPLWLRITPEHYGSGKANPLANLAKARIEKGRLVAGDRIVLALEGADASIASAGDKQVLVKIVPRGPHADLVIPYIAVDEKLVEAGRRLGFEKAVAAAKTYWDARLARGAQLDLPDPVVVRQYKTLFPRTLVTGDLDTHGDYALKTSPLVYDYVWLHCTAYGIEGLARRGHFEEARQYLEAGFRWQGSQRSDASSEYKTWDGFFTAPPRYTALLWLNYHGWFQWAAARYFLFSDDRAWLDAKLPALVKSLEWTASQRKLTMRENPDGTRPANYGWLPPGRVTDGSSGTSTFTDCVNWAGFNEVVRVLERIGHPRAAEFRQVADDYRRAVVRGMRLATRQREPVRLNDGTFVPYVPGYLESKGHEETMWYAAVVDGGLMGVLDSGIVPPGDPLEDWVQQNCEDNLFVMAPNLADEGHFTGQIASYLRRDQPEQAIYTFYSLLATQSSRQTLTTFEHRSWGSNRIYDLAPWPMGYYTRSLAGMLCYDEGDELAYCRATPRAWLAPGKEIRVERLQTRFGPTSFTLKAEAARIRGAIDIPTRFRPSVVRLRLRTPGKVLGVKLDGKEAPFDPATGTVTLPRDAARVEVEATVRFAAP